MSHAQSVNKPTYEYEQVTRDAWEAMTKLRRREEFLSVANQLYDNATSLMIPENERNNLRGNTEYQSIRRVMQGIRRHIGRLETYADAKHKHDAQNQPYPSREAFKQALRREEQKITYQIYVTAWALLKKIKGNAMHAA